ncbi:MAG: protein in Tap1-dppD intergenic region [Lachnospiraceae bacterium]|nr:protein in Tap1-dppD intergenic region [Lachnospiraceae bacterium]
MTQCERRIILIKQLLNEQLRYKDLQIPQDTAEQKHMLRSLFNIRMPKNISDEFLTVQDEYLQKETAKKGITDLMDLSPISDEIYLWQGDITTLHCDAIVNAANSGMTGCYVPCHRCIDNAIPFSITQSCMQSRMAHG